MALGELKKLRDKLCTDNANENANKNLNKLVFMICAVIVTAFAAISLKKKDQAKSTRNSDPLFQLF
tara:strand:- start:5454 stop:5651 length:198 start_codon:yes stop_codon:yes gene_type:complete